MVAVLQPFAGIFQPLNWIDEDVNASMGVFVLDRSSPEELLSSPLKDHIVIAEGVLDENIP